MPHEKNENWGECTECGSPVMIVAATGEAEPCANCASRSSRSGLYLGGTVLLGGLIGIAFVIYICIKAFFLSK